MDQIKIGQFIGELRKQIGLTQSELADKLGVSNKTISKWECGKGLPEISCLLPLCDILNISVNELLSGEKLSQNNYSAKAEENIVHLIQQKEKLHILNKSIHFGTIILITIFCFFLLIVLGLSKVYFLYFLDLTSLLLLLLSTVLLLLVANLWKPFWCGLCSIFSNKTYQKEELAHMTIALDFTSKAILSIGVIIGILEIIQAVIQTTTLSLLLPQFAVALLAPLYGLIAYILLLPIKSRLAIQLQTLSKN